MAKINKLQKSGVTIYPLTIPEAVVDSVSGKTQKQVNDEFKAIQDGQLKIKNEVVNGDYQLLSSYVNNFSPILMISLIKGRKYYTRRETRLVLGAVPTESTGRMYTNTGSHSLVSGNSIPGVGSLIYTHTSNDVINTIVTVFGASSGKVEFVNTFIVDLTQAFGVGNEPTKAEMDELVKILPNGYFEGNLQQKYLHIWQLKLIRQNRNAIVALGGTII